MATTHAPGAGTGRPGMQTRRWMVGGAVALVCAAIVVPFGVHGLDHDASARTANPATKTSQAPRTPHRTVHHTSSLGRHGDLPPLLPARSPSLQAGEVVRVGDVTTGTMRRTPHTGWQVVVRWNGRLQAVPTKGPVALGASSWVSSAGALYTRVPTGMRGRFDVFAWDPQGGSAYTPPTLVAVDLGPVCFDQAFTAFGDCGG